MTGVSVYQALAQARDYWDSKGPSSRMMPIRAQACATYLGPNMARKLAVTDLTPSHATRILTSLHRTKGKGSVPVYFAAFKRAVEMAGGDTRNWPKAGQAPRRVREPLSEADLDRLAGSLNGPTRDLLELLRGTGLRVEREALNGEALRWDNDRHLLHVTGKGGHERLLPVERLGTVELLNDPERLREMRRVSYSWHLKVWNAAVRYLRIESKKPTPHAVRHYYATAAYARSGHNLRAVQELLGHADINTTARYLGVDLDALRSAVA